MGPYTRLLRRLGHQRWWSILGPRLVRVDRELQRRTRGRLSVIGRPQVPMLLAEPAARVTISGKQIPVTARLAALDERDRAWRLVQVVWPAYQT